MHIFVLQEMWEDKNLIVNKNKYSSMLTILKMSDEKSIMS